MTVLSHCTGLRYHVRLILGRMGYNTYFRLYHTVTCGGNCVKMRIPHFNVSNTVIFSGPALIPYLDGIAPVSRMAEGPVRIPIVDRYKVS